MQRYQNSLIYYHSFISVARVNLLVILISHWLGCLYGLTYEVGRAQPIAHRSTTVSDPLPPHTYTARLKVFEGVLLSRWFLR